MRIICLIESLGAGGAERQMSGLAVLLKKAGHDVKVVTYYPQDFYRTSLDAANVDYYYAEEAQSKFKRIRVLYHIVKDFNPDVCIAYLPTATIVACIIKILGIKAKLIVSERNTSQKNSFQDFIRFSFFKVAADWVVPNSYMQESFIKEHYTGLMNKVRVITNFVDTDLFKPGESKDRDIPRILCV
jgi:glycosyltransferase involved in cell wall biosynthesis